MLVSNFNHESGAERIKLYRKDQRSHWNFENKYGIYNE